jgi:hypothetical protein
MGDAVVGTTLRQI